MSRLVPYNDDAQLSVATAKPNRSVVSVLNIPTVDPEYSSVLLRIKLFDGSFATVEMGSVDAQKLGHALNRAGGGTL